MQVGTLAFLQHISPADSMDSLNSTSPGEGLPAAPPQFAVLDFIFPGFSTLSSIIHHYLGFDLNVYIPLLLIVSGVVFVGNYIWEYSWGIIGQYLMSTVRIRHDDEIFNIVMAWVVKQRFSQGSRRFMVNINIKSRSFWLYDWDDDNNDENDSKKPLKYTPSAGSHWFWYRGHYLNFERIDNRERFASSSPSEELSISCFGRNPRIIKELLLDAQDQYVQKDDEQTVIYRSSNPTGNNGADPSWQRCMSRVRRPISTVILSEKTKNDLIDDVTDYLNPNTRRWYANRGIPYRRGYLLYGPPGTGKSSLSLALAGHFNMRIYMVSLNSIHANEETLGSLFTELPSRCVVLLEDIDTAGLTHTREEKNGDNSTETVADPVLTTRSGAPTVAAPVPVGRLSLSGLLNILDGVASQEGRVLIMTTNHLEKLDKALIRPGRVDKIVQFGLADADMSASIFRAIYAPYEGEDVDVGVAKANYLDPEEALKQAALAKKTRLETLERINALATKFAAKMPSLEFSPAEIQGLLLKNKRDPDGVIDAIDEWAVETRKERKQKEIDDAEKRRKE
jgi:chaperone BCS1